jgi:predicted alpha/beta-hydrolase family hydrolase
VTAIDIETPAGTARVHLRPVESPRAALVLGHGAGGSVGAPDLQAAAEAAEAQGISVALVEQPYRVAGRRSPPAASRLDAAWTAVLEHLAAGELRDLPLITGGRSSGARVACRTAGQTGAVAVLCLAFPLVPPRATPDKTRQPELDAVDVPMLIVQGERDPFGMPQPSPTREIAQVPGDHSLRGATPVRDAVAEWLSGQAATPE